MALRRKETMDCGKSVEEYDYVIQYHMYDSMSMNTKVAQRAGGPAACHKPGPT